MRSDFSIVEPRILPGLAHQNEHELTIFLAPFSFRITKTWTRVYDNSTFFFGVFVLEWEKLLNDRDKFETDGKITMTAEINVRYCLILAILYYGTALFWWLWKDLRSTYTFELIAADFHINHLAVFTNLTMIVNCLSCIIVFSYCWIEVGLYRTWARYSLSFL